MVIILNNIIENGPSTYFQKKPENYLVSFDVIRYEKSPVT